MFFHVIQEQRVHIFQDLVEALQRQEHLVDRIGRLLAVCVAFQLITLDFLFDDGGYHIVLIGKELVDGLFGNAQLGSDLIHRDRPDAIAAEQVSGFHQYSIFYFHTFIHFGRAKPCRVTLAGLRVAGCKTKKTFYVVKVSMVFLAMIYLFNPNICFTFGLQSSKMSINNVKQLRDFDSFFELVNYFNSEEKCVEYLATLRWNGVIECPYCANDTCYVLNGANKDSNALSAGSNSASGSAPSSKILRLSLESGFLLFTCSQPTKKAFPPTN